MDELRVLMATIMAKPSGPPNDGDRPERPSGPREGGGKKGPGSGSGPGGGWRPPTFQPGG